MRIVFAGTPDVAVPALDALVASKHEVLAVITRPDAPVGRGRKLAPSPVAQRASELGIEVLKPQRPSELALADRIAALAPDAAAVVAYGGLLPQTLLDLVPQGWINLHFSQLPRWRGAAPVQHAIWAGDETIATCCFRIVKQLDAGPIFSTQTEALPQLPAGEVLERLAESGAKQLSATLTDIENGAEPTDQPSEGATYAKKIEVSDARLNFERPAIELQRQILACSPHPGAWCEIEGNRFKIFNAAALPGSSLRPGQLASSKKSVTVGSAEGDLQLLEVQAPGKRRMAALDWARGGIPERLQ